MAAMAVQLPEGGSVIGVGIDLVEVERIHRAVERHGDRFLKRVFTGGEIAYCMGMRNPHPHLAARFAAKEAVSKAFTTGIGSELNWTSIEVCKGERQEPYVRLDAAGDRLLQAVGATGVLLSLAHTADYGEAVALLVRSAEPPH